MGRNKKNKSPKSDAPKSGPPSKQVASNTAAPVAPTESQRSFRRILIYLTFLAVVLSLFGGYWLYDSNKKERLARDCEAAQARGDWASLEMTAREWAAWEPDNYLPWKYAATAAQEVGNKLKTIEYLSNMPKDGPILAFMELADLQYQHDMVKKAATSFKFLVERAPESKEAHRRLNFYYAMTRQRNKLVAESRRAIENDADIPETYVFLVGADWITFTNGYMVNVQWAEQYPDDNQLFEVASALHLISAGVDQSMEQIDEKLKARLSQSADLIQNLRKKYPNNREIIILELMYNVHRAEARKVGEILNSLEIDIEDDSRFHRVIGWFHSYSENWEEAEKSYLKCLELNPFDWQCRHEYAMVLRQTKQTEQLKDMQAAAATGKEIMRRVLQAENTVNVPRTTLQLIIDYCRMCGEAEIAKKLSDRIYSKLP